MARVIKAGGQGGQRPARAPGRVVVETGGKKVIERAVYQAKQDAAHILKRADEERQKRLSEGKRKAAQAREEAMARGASEAFAAAAAEALQAFRRRAERYAEAAEDIRVLAVEVVKKILGADPDLGARDIDKILQRGLAQLRARRRLRVQVSQRRLGELAIERPNLMKALQNEPDLVMEATDDVNTGFARVVTEIGGALCAEETALDALSQAVNVRETPRGTVATDKIARPSSTSLRSDVPDAVVEDLDDGNDEDEDTMQMVARRRSATSEPDEEVEEISADEEEASAMAARPADRRDRVRTGKVVAPARPATRVVPIAEADSEKEDDADLELFTDDAVGRSRRKR